MKNQNNDTYSLAHTTWKCQYHIVFTPKYHRKIIYGALRAEIGLWWVRYNICQPLLYRTFLWYAMPAMLSFRPWVWHCLPRWVRKTIPIHSRISLSRTLLPTFPWQKPPKLNFSRKPAETEEHRTINVGTLNSRPAEVNGTKPKSLRTWYGEIV